MTGPDHGVSTERGDDWRELARPGTYLRQPMYELKTDPTHLADAARWPEPLPWHDLGTETP